MTEALAQHPPAIRVGGRRLSVNSRPKAHSPVEAKPPSPPTEPTDYPRPAAPGEQTPHHEEEEVPKKEKKKGNGGDEHERRLQENLYRKAELNRPSKDTHGAKNTNAIGGGGRIGQPAGRTMF